MAVIMLVIGVRKIRLKKRTTNRIMRTCIVLEAACVLILPLAHVAGAFSPNVHFWLCVAVTFFGSFAIFYWLRRARGCGSTTAVLYVFSALAISEVEIYVCSLIGTYGFYVAAALILLQFPCMLSARKNKLANDIESFTPNDDFFGFATTLLSSKRFLTATATSIGVLSIVDGFLRGYPDGVPIAFQPATRVAYGLLTIAICVIVISMMMRKRKSVMTVGMFILLELFACAALVLYAAFPDMPDIGAGKASVLFGDFSKFKIRMVKDFRVIRLNELLAEYLSIGIFGFARLDGLLLNAGTHPIKKLVHAASGA